MSRKSSRVMFPSPSSEKTSAILCLNGLSCTQHTFWNTILWKNRDRKLLILIIWIHNISFICFRAILHLTVIFRDRVWDGLSIHILLIHRKFPSRHFLLLHINRYRLTFLSRAQAACALRSFLLKTTEDIWKFCLLRWILGKYENELYWSGMQIGEVNHL